MFEKMLPDDFGEQIDEYLGPIIATFTVKTVPQGGAPEEIKEKWVGMHLPVRKHLIEKPPFAFVDTLTGELTESFGTIPVYGFDAIAVLRFNEENEAADFWAINIGHSTLMFQAHEGELVPNPQ